LAGLVSITPAAGFVDLGASIIIGLGGGAICYGGVLIKKTLGYDDALDVVGIHGLGGTWGALATGLFAVAAVGGVNGLMHGNFGQFGAQAVSVLATWAYCYPASRLILSVVKFFTPLRCSDEEEDLGLDIAMHNERSYTL
jgi:Amt family ammonium transporter